MEDAGSHMDLSIAMRQCSKGPQYGTKQGHDTQEAQALTLKKR